MITLTRALLEQTYQHLFGEPLPSMFLFGIRGAKPVVQEGLDIEPCPQQLDLYDDTIGFMVSDGRGHCYSGSVDPGRYYTENPMPGTGGCAHVLEGHYTFVKGQHKSEPRAWKGLNVKCWRDLDRDNVQGADENKVYTLATSIDLHYGGNNTVGEYSAGCQVVRRPYWATYRDLTYSLFPNTATYWLLNVHTLLQMQTDNVVPTVIINNTPVPSEVPLWLSLEGRVVTPLRSFLAHLQSGGMPVSLVYDAVAGTTINGVLIQGSLVHNQYVCAVGDILRLLDGSIDISWDAGSARITANSQVVAVVAPVSTMIASFEDDDTPIPNETA